MSGGSRPRTQRTLTPPRLSAWPWARMRTSASSLVLRRRLALPQRRAVCGRTGSSVGLLLPAAERG
eukprot:2417064-Pleurochrysis_carterae.AAC.1